jgi:signal transduction histidine kinase/CheY-like chemotaxis protein
MLKIRSKVLITIVAVVATIMMISLSSGLFFIQGSMKKTLESDMTMFASIASKLASSRLESLKNESLATASRLPNLELEPDLPPGWTSLLLEQEGRRRGYLSIALFDAQHQLTASYGEELPGRSYADNEYARRAYRGETVVASTETTHAGHLIIRVYAPANGQLLISTLPGLIMSDLLSEFRILSSGNIFVLDKEGVFVANMRPQTVMERYDIFEFNKFAQSHNLYVDHDRLFERMLRGESGIGHYIFDGDPRICAFMPIPNSDGWSLGVSAAMADTPQVQTQHLLLIASLIITIIGGVVAYLASGAIARPFEIIDAQNTSLHELKQEAENASEAKSHFLANTSHEMRTPLNAIIGLTELMLDDANDITLPGEVVENLDKIYTSGVTLLSIVNDILDIAKIESGKLELIPVEYDVPSMINDTRGLNVLRLTDKPVEFNLIVDENMPSKLYGDELRVKQIFNNLLSNACKYTHKGTIEWSLTCEREGNTIWLVSSIKDSGIGIRKEDIAKLFSDFAQVDTRSNRAIEGTGLGLAITLRMLKKMDGTVTVDSVYGEGSTFTVRLRQGFVSDATLGHDMVQNLMRQRYTTSKRAHNTKFTRIPMPYARVLVVDDVQTNLDVAKGIMKPYGMQVDCVTNGSEAIRLVRAAAVKYDAIFMDHMMPGMDGIETTRVIREEIGTNYAETVPIIALTANAIVGNEKLFLEHGFQAFLTKPVDLMRMDAALRRWVRKPALEQQTSASGATENTPAPAATAPLTPAPTASPVPDAAPSPQINGLNWQAGLDRFGDKETWLTILHSYASNTVHLLEQVRDPNADNLADYAIRVHGIKGASYGIEAHAVGSLAEALEHAAETGDLAFVLEHNPGFIEQLNTLLKDLATLTQETDAANAPETRETREAPDPALLHQMKDAAENYLIEAMEETMNQLEAYQYLNQGDLITWLRSQTDQMEFSTIVARLEQHSEQ